MVEAVATPVSRIIIFGTSIVSLENVEGRFRFKGRTVGFMLIACAAWAAELAIFIAGFIPKLATERVERSHVVMKGVAICITGFDAYLLLVAR